MSLQPSNSSAQEISSGSTADSQTGDELLAEFLDVTRLPPRRRQAPGPRPPGAAAFSGCRGPLPRPGRVAALIGHPPRCSRGCRQRLPRAEEVVDLVEGVDGPVDGEVLQCAGAGGGAEPVPQIVVL